MPLRWQRRCSGIRTPEFRLRHEAVWKETPPLHCRMEKICFLWLSDWGVIYTVYTFTNPWAHTIAKYNAVCHVTLSTHIVISFSSIQTYNPGKLKSSLSSWFGQIQPSASKIWHTWHFFETSRIHQKWIRRGGGHTASHHCKASWEWCLLMHSPNDKSASRGDRERSVLAHSSTVPLISSWFMDRMAGYAPRH